MVTIQFHGTVHSNTGTQVEVVEDTTLNVLNIQISDKRERQSITLDKRTAIKFCKELRRCISQLND